MAARLRASAAVTLVATAAGACGGGSQPARPAASRAPTPSGYSAPTTGRVADVWALGDAAVAQTPAYRVARMVRRARPELLLYLGDVYPTGLPGAFRTYDRLYGALAKRTAPAIGNHESPTRAIGFDPYWTRKLGRPLPPYYALRAGGWTLIALDSELRGAAARRQVAWLRRTASRGGGTCRLAYSHRTRYSAGPHGDQGDIAPLWNALRGRARLVLGAHDHDMQRLRRRSGITELIAGAGGNGLYPLRRRHGLAFGNDTAYGALRMRLSAGRAQLAFVSASGRVLDRSAVRCAR